MMNMESGNQYLKELRLEYLKTKSKKGRGKLLTEAEKRTRLSRKYLIRKLKPKSNLDKKKEDRKKRKIFYDGYFKVALIRIWEILDYPFILQNKNSFGYLVKLLDTNWPKF